jgi:hypothetical protein
MPLAPEHNNGDIIVSSHGEFEDLFFHFALIVYNPTLVFNENVPEKGFVHENLLPNPY